MSHEHTINHDKHKKTEPIDAQFFICLSSIILIALTAYGIALV